MLVLRWGRLGQEWGTTKDHEKAFGHGRYVHYLDCCDGFTGVHIFQNYQVMYFKYVQFVYINYISMKLIKVTMKSGNF